MDDSTPPAVREMVAVEMGTLWTRMRALLTAGEDLALVEQDVRQGVLGLGARLLEAGVAAQGTGVVGGGVACACGSRARLARYRTKQVQTLLGWMSVRRAAYRCGACGVGWCPLDAVLGLERDSASPGVRRLGGEFGARLPFAPAAALLERAAAVRLSASTLRGLTERIGAQREAAVAAQRASAWREGLPAVAGPVPERLYVAMDGVRILGTAGAGREIKVGVVIPVQEHARRGRASYVAGLEPAPAFGQRLALEAHRRGLERAGMVAVLGDGAAWIWTLAAEHFPGALHIVDWFHASERIWDLGRALWGDDTPETTAWVTQQLARLAQGEATALVHDWQALSCTGAAAAVRTEQATYFTNQAPRMAYDRYRSAGWDIGSGMVEGACKHLIAAREKGPGMRWSDAGAQHVAAVRVAIFNQPDGSLALAA